SRLALGAGVGLGCSGSAVRASAVTDTSMLRTECTWKTFDVGNARPTSAPLVIAIEAAWRSLPVPVKLSPHSAAAERLITSPGGRRSSNCSTVRRREPERFFDVGRSTARRRMVTSSTKTKGLIYFGTDPNLRVNAFQALIQQEVPKGCG